MTQDNGHPIAPVPEESQEERSTGRRAWPLWVLGGALVGAIAGLNVAEDRHHGFYLGAAVGTITEALIAVWVNQLPGGASGSLRMAFAAIATGIGIGAAAGTLIPAPDAGPDKGHWLTLGMVLGGLIGLLDRLIVWFGFPYGEGVRAPAGETQTSAEQA